MGRIQYFLVNETRKEFCSFNDRVPVYEELKRSMDAWPKWALTDKIMIKGEDESKGSDLWDHLTMNLEYKDLDYGEHMESIWRAYGELNEGCQNLFEHFLPRISARKGIAIGEASSARTTCS